MDSTPEQPRHLGEYRLDRCLAETATTRTWLAEQESVRRLVLIEELREEAADRADAMLADIRAKAAVDHPLIGSIYEAVAEPGQCYCARELLPGATLADRLKASEPLKPARLAYYLRRISEANCYHESRNQATSPFGPEAVFVDDQGVIRLENLAIAGPRPPEQSAADILHFGRTLPALVADGLPGATRLLTLLAWMRGEQTTAAPGWAMVHSYCEQIEQQLAQPPLPIFASHTAAVVPKRNPVLIWVVAGAVVVLLGGGFLALQSRRPPPPPRASLPDAVEIPAGNHPTPDGATEPLRTFRIAAHEVTIGQYQEFLDALEVLSQSGLKKVNDDDNQPPEKADHLPTDWEALVAAARARGTWQGQAVTLDSPVVGVDWWDAVAYANWKKARLPTQEEWFAALRHSVKDPATLKPGAWQPVGPDHADRTPDGIFDLAGSVSEWTRRPAVNPANPMGARLWVIIGASGLKPANGALAREWTPDRTQRRPDLGFRLVFDGK